MPEVGTIIGGKYRLLRELGQGGMGMVYRALHMDISKPVAIKFLLPQYSRDSQLLGRFLQEARAASAVGHRGIVDVYDLGVDDDGTPYFVMELLKGQPFADLVDGKGKVDIETSAYVLCNILSALSFAHDAGIVHRDLKPENIFLVDTGAALFDVKLLDFGISRVRGGSWKVSRLTETGAVMGTPFYMSPEQAEGLKDIDHRADIYSVGVILYQCLTGKLPFHADNYNAMMIQIISAELVPPSMHAPELTSDVEEVICRAMEKDRNQRYQTAAEFFDALLPFVAERSVDRIPLPRRPTPSLPAEADKITVPDGRQSPSKPVPSNKESGKLERETPPPESDETPTVAPPRITPAPREASIPPGTAITIAPVGKRARLITVASVLLLVVLLVAGIGGGVWFAGMNSQRPAPDSALDRSPTSAGLPQYPSETSRAPATPPSEQQAETAIVSQPPVETEGTTTGASGDEATGESDAGSEDVEDASVSESRGQPRRRESSPLRPRTAQDARPPKTVATEPPAIVTPADLQPREYGQELGRSRPPVYGNEL